MINVELKGIHRVRKRLANGTWAVYHYAWRGGPRLPGGPGCPEFLAAYAAAIRRDPPPDVFASILRQYEASAAFTDLRDSTKADYRGFLTRLEAKFGTMPIAALDDPKVGKHFIHWRDSIRGKRRADYAIMVLKVVLSWAKEQRLISTNQASGIKGLYTVDRSEKIWDDATICKFMADAPAGLRLAMILGVNTGQREGDLLRLPWSAYDGSCIRLRQSKSRSKGREGRRVEIPCTAELRAALDSVTIRGPLILTNAWGRPWSARGFQGQWRQHRDACGITDLRFHDLRGTAATRLAEADCTVPQIAAIIGWSVKYAAAMLEHYLKRTPKIAEAAIRKLEQSK